MTENGGAITNPAKLIRPGTLGQPLEARPGRYSVASWKEGIAL
jgi:hypothetical protein